MQQQEPLLLEPLLGANKINKRNLLPLWMKVFIWIFMVMGAMAPVCFLAGVWGAKFQVSLYGLESGDPFSPAGAFVLLLFFFKGIVAYGLWTEKRWAVNLGIMDAIVGIAVCTYLMVVLPFLQQEAGFVMNFRLELLALVPYLIKLRKIKPLWQLS